MRQSYGSIYDVVGASIRSLLKPELTASWEKGLNYVAEGTITPDEYMEKLENFIRKWTNGVMGLRNQSFLTTAFKNAAVFYKKNGSAKKTGEKKKASGDTGAVS